MKKELRSTDVAEMNPPSEVTAMNQAVSTDIDQPIDHEKAADQKVPPQDAIRLRAYEIYCARNGAPGDEVADWLQAERELRPAQ